MSMITIKRKKILKIFFWRFAQIILLNQLKQKGKFYQKIVVHVVNVVNLISYFIIKSITINWDFRKNVLTHSIYAGLLDFDLGQIS